MYLIELGAFKPFIISGSLLFLDLNDAPNFLKGMITLEKSLLDKLLSPIKVILFSKLINKPKINLPKVPEFPASIVNFFLDLFFKPVPVISHFFFCKFYFRPQFFNTFNSTINIFRF